MIIFFSDGRLGNQLFQYAFLKTVSNTNEKIIATEMDNFLKVFVCHNKNFKNLSIGKYSRFFIRKVFKKILYFLIRIRLVGYIKQLRNNTSSLPSYTEKKGILPIKYVETNFFQSEKLFDANKIDFEIREQYLKDAVNALSHIDNSYTKVFVHVRRGDYLSESYLGKRGINLPKKYFYKAIEGIKQDMQNPYFIFLSDDPEFVECCFESIGNKYISTNSMAIDLAIMSLCEYGIASNSSFSWWGAYLMQNRKKVIFPKYWYGWKSKVESHIDIQPNWAEVIGFE
ncbi:alpha-1,2-fucosyltransferase [Francisella philomiragia]|uniref:alpha-1,2-fucosyltransferase n=1 Tax=Francisella philomiragia TaxID=28110 RepID=UPI001903B6E9|nr:alpha-1,2-fucosyltransferase [Francisella philomiragia]MBK2340594.1 alpha-1,2-fucosyltransferase [Francisella philomiragia]